MATTWPHFSITWGTKGPALNPQTIKDLLTLSGGHPELIGLRFQAPMNMLIQSSFNVYDNAVQQCNNAGIPIMLTCKRAPDAAPAGATDMLSFATTLATRYDGNHGHGTVQAVDIGNEDYQYSNFGLLADTMNAVYPALKSINPDLLILPGATLQRNSTNMKAAVTTLLQKAGKYIDGINIHTYFGIPGTGPHTPDVGTVNNVPSFAQYVQAIKDVCAACGYPAMPIYDTECGFPCTGQNHSGVPIFSEADQWKWIQYCLDQARQAGVRHMSIFTLGYGSPPDGMSLVQNGPTVAFHGLQAYIAKYPQLGTIGSSDPGSSGDPGSGSGSSPQPDVASAIAALKSAQASLSATQAAVTQALADLQPTP